MVVPVYSWWMVLFTSETAFHCTRIENVGLHSFCTNWTPVGLVCVINWGEPWYSTLTSQSGKC